MNTDLIFEGPEKKIEMILCDPFPGVRDNADGKWDRVVASARAEILHSISTPLLDAYLLSESSLFVWGDRILMITCGRTNLFHALPEMLRFIPKEQVAFLFYEQKNLLFPDHQPSTFEQGARLLKEYFPGQISCIGPTDGDHIHLFTADTRHSPVPGDMTLQVLMHDISPDAARHFENDGRRSAADVPAITGLDRLFSDNDVQMDGYLFFPCGYSLNAVKNDRYYTIHATPQSEGSYVSFETNFPKMEYPDTVRRLLTIFAPRRFTLMLTADAPPVGIADLTNRILDALPGYTKTHQTCMKPGNGYEVSFFNFRRP